MRGSQKMLVVVAGPTASGKTALAIRLAQRFGAEIISADSRQFFRAMNIGTAQPSPGERAAVPHHFVDFLAVTDDYSVGDFEEQTLERLEQLFGANDVVIMAGGSGLYLDAVCTGFDALPKSDPAIRAALNELVSENGLAPLLQELERADPEFYERVDRKNPQRVIRALEVYRVTGRKFSAFRTARTVARPFECLWIGLETPREILYDRINRRVDVMMEAGLLAEVETLVPFRSYNALRTVGYTELFDYLDGKVTLPEAVEAIKQNTRRFAKRQLTWFRKNDRIAWFDASDEAAILAYIAGRLNPATR